MPRTVMTYDSVEEATNRLGGTVVTYDGQPVLVESIRDHPDGVLRVNFRVFPYNGDLVRKKINSPAFRRFATPPLGFCNYFERGDPNCAWLERTSARSRRQGLCSEVFAGTRLQSGERIRFENVYTSDGFREMVVGEYPTFDDALARLVPNSSIAVSREFALAMNPSSYVFLHHKRDEIGLVMRGMIYLRPDRGHMVETIYETAALPDRVEIM